MLDQIEAIGRCRGSEDDTDERTWDRLLSCLLIELDGMRSENVQSRGEQPSGGSGGVYVIGTTTRLSSLAETSRHHTVFKRKHEFVNLS